MQTAKALAAALALSGCAFSSEQPLFAAAQSAQPFADGAQFIWRFEDEGPLVVKYRRTPSGDYWVQQVDDHQELMEVAFFDVSETPEEDYILQIRMDAADSGRVYAFMWRSGEDYIIYTDPGVLNHGPGPALRAEHCTMRSFGECALSDADALLLVYRELVYATYVRFGLRQDAIVQSPLIDASQSIENQP